MAPFGWTPPYDDAYITLTSAQALYSGSIPNYPGTPALYGITSPVHVVLIAGLLPFSDPLTALWISQAIGAALYLSGLFALARAWALPYWQAALFVLVGLSAGMIPYQLFNGLETGLALGCVTWAIALTAKQSNVAPVVLGVLPFVRPELAILSGALGLCVMAAQPWRRAGLLMLAGAAPFALLMFWQVGSILPTSTGAKVAFLTDTCLPNRIKLFLALVAIVTWSGAIGLVTLGLIGAWRSSLTRICLGAFAVALCGYTLNAATQIPRYHAQRYLYAWLPILLLGGLAALRPVPKVRAFVLPLVLLVAVIRVPVMYAEHRTWVDVFLPEERALVSWLQTNVPKDSKLLVIDAGYLAYATDYRLIDAVGLKSPASTVFHELMTLPSCGGDRGVALVTIARETGVSYFVSWGEWEDRFRMADSFAEQGWLVTQVRPKPAGVGEWWYPVYRLQHQ